MPCEYFPLLSLLFPKQNLLASFWPSVLSLRQKEKWFLLLCLCASHNISTAPSYNPSVISFPSWQDLVYSILSSEAVPYLLSFLLLSLSFSPFLLYCFWDEGARTVHNIQGADTDWNYTADECVIAASPPCLTQVFLSSSDTSVWLTLLCESKHLAEVTI